MADDHPDRDPSEGETGEDKKKGGWFKRLRAGLGRSAANLGGGITGIFTKAKLDDDTLEELEDLLISADLGPAVAARVTEKLAKERYDKEVSPDEVRAVLAEQVAQILDGVAAPLDVERGHRPHVILMVGVNGTGKTTTIGKLASKFRAEGKSVMLAAGDTFRAAAVEQLAVWGERVGCPVVTTKLEGDAAGLAYDALVRAEAEGIDVLMIDTAGRLQNKAALMDELSKVIRVVTKKLGQAPHDTLLVLDATTGQNAVQQIDVFKDQAGVTGLVMTKLDGSARGGVLVAAAEKFDLPVHFVGVGEGVDDLQPFDPQAFAKALVDAV
ncbi:fused signal recognition particle receptor [Rhodothalassium salexigens DSM 2132]|uniref:Signal recognition particle receptor FtsY n=1 Tax=Rhodothalassium salexigens DSM 2132 TaxID=1188247 RepID=A0A4V2SNV3_RHOSA|nr:signal recognition particle-docking protein FtsY [Rhodothalassium salexigens]MBB4212323.1 fused signal recognition particle receptor [Rhodothalassium salexigens DSM 2132]MBK1638823.1 signal recognition particle-docking protein FtsY [Rhodothalassium salexigens DSM 2132]TCP32526.1 fused signal recognition particle receptor [Rhodothalassium salexigens DSM 2132]